MNRQVSFKPDIRLERYEAKYIIPYHQLSAIRDFIRPFCIPDLHCEEESNEYLLTTLQLDNQDLALYRAKEDEALERFKLRVRTYGIDSKAPVFLEIKRKIKDVIVKTRSAISPELWPQVTESFSRRQLMPFTFHNTDEAHNYYTFFKLVHEIGARPMVLIRYKREAYIGKFDRYSRVTFDRNLCYRRQRYWELTPRKGHWWTMDTMTDLNRPFSGAILELKTYNDVPMWMVELTERFNLERVGFSKYFAAVRKELLFNGGFVL